MLARTFTLDILGEVAKKGQSLPQKAVQNLLALLRNPLANLEEDIGLVMKTTLGKEENEEVGLLQLFKMVAVFKGSDIYAEDVQAKARVALCEVVKNGQNKQPMEVMEELFALLKDPGAKSMARDQAASALSEMAQSRQGLPQKTVVDLIMLLGNTSISSGIRSQVITVLGAVVESGRVLPLIAFSILTLLLREQETDSKLRALAAAALGKAVKNGQGLSQETLKELIVLLADLNVSPEIRGQVATIFGEAAKNRQTLPLEVLKGLVALLGDQKASSGDRDHAVVALGEVAKNKQTLPKEALEGLSALLAAQKVNSRDRGHIAVVLGEAAKNRQTLPQKALEGLIKLLGDPESYLLARDYAAAALGEVAKNRQDLQEAIKGLFLLLKDPRFNSWSYLATDILSEVVKNGQALPQNLLDFLCKGSQLHKTGLLNLVADTCCKFSHEYEPEVLRDLFFLTGRAFYFRNGSFYTTGHMAPLRIKSSDPKKDCEKLLDNPRI